MAAVLSRVVLDTNIVVSALWGGVPQQVLEAWFAERYTLLISPPILREYEEVFRRLFPNSAAAARLLHAVYLKAISIRPKEKLGIIRQDPDDDRFLECAAAGKADFLVSGDQHLFQLKHFRKTRILAPRAFLGFLG